jgi:hypothetical protein
VLNHAEVVVPEALWGGVVSQRTVGLGSAGPGYMLKCLYLNGPRAWLAVHKVEWACLGPDSTYFLCSFLAPGLYRPGRFGWRGAAAATNALPRRRMRCRGNFCAAAATLALSRRRWHSRGDASAATLGCSGDAVAATLPLPRRRGRGATVAAPRSRRRCRGGVVVATLGLSRRR